jgi:hypothetical protein
MIDYSITDASVHDSQVSKNLIDENDAVVYADSAYVGEKIHERTQKAHTTVELKVIEKAVSGKELAADQKAKNKEKSKIRVRVEDVFGYMINLAQVLMIPNI